MSAEANGNPVSDLTIPNCNPIFTCTKIAKGECSGKWKRSFQFDNTEPQPILSKDNESRKQKTRSSLSFCEQDKLCGTGLAFFGAKKHSYIFSFRNFASENSCVKQFLRLFSVILNIRTSVCTPRKVWKREYADCKNRYSNPVLFGLCHSKGSDRYAV